MVYWCAPARALACGAIKRQQTSIEEKYAQTRHCSLEIRLRLHVSPFISPVALPQSANEKTMNKSTSPSYKLWRRCHPLLCLAHTLTPSLPLHLSPSHHSPPLSTTPKWQLPPPTSSLHFFPTESPLPSPCPSAPPSLSLASATHCTCVPIVVAPQQLQPLVLLGCCR